MSKYYKYLAMLEFFTSGMWFLNIFLMLAKNDAPFAVLSTVLTIVFAFGGMIYLEKTDKNEC